MKILYSLVIAAIICCFAVEHAAALECASESLAGIKVSITCPRPWDGSDKIFCCGATCCNAQEQAAHEFEKVGQGVLDSIGVDDSKLSTEVIIGIGVGVVALVIILISVCCCCCPCCLCYKKRHGGAVYGPAAKL